MDGMKPYRGDKPYIFISYAHRDRERIAPILRQLISLRYRVWYDEGIDPGTEWDNNIATHIEGCTFLFAFISANYLQSDNCKDELNFARDLQKERLLIYLEDVKLPLGMAMRLNRLQAIHQYTYTRQEDFYDKLVSVPDLGVCQDPPPQHTEPSETAPGNLPRIKVIGVGGAGCNIVNRLMDYGPKLVEYIAVNTDKQSLSHSRAPVRVLIGEKETKGLGAAGSAET
ncbi:MAG: TIR domain-containing protein [Clostridiales bacterium]|nr:TIR domain-containing protein [Clostridiales bacterium]